jgi:aminopeptidase N
MSNTAPKTIRLQDYCSPAYLIDTVDLDIALDPERTVVASKLRLRPNPDAGKHAGKNSGKHASKQGSLNLDGENLELAALTLNGAAVPRSSYTQTTTTLTIKNIPQEPFTLEITTVINPEANKVLQGLYRSRGVYCSQCEAEGFRRITYFQDRPDVLSVYTCRIEADQKACPVLLSNGNLTSKGKLAGGRHFAVWHDPHPKPCYLFAVVGGTLGAIHDTFKTASGHTVDLNIYVEPGKEARAAWAMECLKRSMRWDETRFGREYDLDVFNIVAVSDFNMGAMENKGLNIFNDRLILASEDTASDAMFEAIEAVVAHEYFHNWTGNRITCRDWFQLCLKEGLTVYRDQEFSADERSRTVQRIADVRQLKATQFPEDQGPLAHPVRPDSYIEIDNFYTATVYEKGAELVRMIDTILGPDTFRAGMDLYFDRHDGQAVTIEHFLACFEEASGKDLAQFKLWYQQPGTPDVVCKLSYDKVKKQATLDVSQVQRDTPGMTKKQPLHIPLRLALFGGNGRPLDLELADGTTLDQGVVHITERHQTFKFKSIPSKPIPSFNRGFSAPINLSFSQDDRELAFLIEHDSDLFNRWQSVNLFASRTIQSMVAALKDGKRGARGTAYAKALGAALADPKLEPAYRAELMKLPTQGDIARDIGRNIDPGLIYKCVRQLAKQTGTILGDELQQLYAKSRTKGGFSADAKSAGLRAQRNGALALLVARGTEDDATRLKQHYLKATTMTDEATALVHIAAGDFAFREEAMERFYKKWNHDHLVIDTWFAAQALSPLDCTLDRVKALTRHPLFSMTAPNKVRALVGNFALQNALQFNRPDGSGYVFLCETVLVLDQKNPKVAARMLGALRSWRALESRRRALAKKSLKSVASTNGLSRDVFEIVTKMLDD